MDFKSGSNINDTQNYEISVVKLLEQSVFVL